MKKLVILLALVALPAGVFAQGQIAFANATTPDSRFSTNSGAQPPPGQVANASGFMDGVNTYIIGLYSAPNGTVDESLFILRQTTTNRSGAARGLFTGGGGATPPGFPVGQQVAFQLRAWQLTSGGAADTYDNAILPGQYRGKTAIGFVTAGDATTGPAGILFGTGPGQVLGAVLAPNASVPEPSSIALGLLGLGAIALFRRRK